MTQPCRTRCLAAFVAALATLILPSATRAGTWVPFGPKTYTRSSGAPITMTATFTLLNPATQYTLKAFNGGLQDDTTELVSNCVVLLNGVQVIGPGNFARNVAELDVPISPGFTNTLSVQVRGKPGGVLVIEIVGVDNDPPTITASLNPSPNAAGWNNSPVTATFTCSDKTSGVASCPSPVTVSAEGANQVVSGTATDLAGNTATTSVTVNLDMTPPTITGTINPPPDAGGYNSSAVSVTFTCADALSGVASCSSPVAVTSEVTAHVVSGTAVDVAGNTATASVTVNISFKYFKIRSWQTNPSGDPLQTGKCLDYGSQGTAGATVYLNDCASAHPIRVFEMGIPGLPGTPDISPPRIGSGGTKLYHEAMLFAGRQVIAIHNPPINSLGGPPPPPSTEFPLELQDPWYAHPANFQTGPENQILRLDGDSIILEGTSIDPGTGAAVPGPCINTATSNSLCPPPPPQLVIQIQSARGANGSPLVAGVRNLADHELWDFVATDGSGRFPTSGFNSTPIATDVDLWNAYCKKPQVVPVPGYPAGTVPPMISDGGLFLPRDVPCGTLNVGWGSVIVVTDSDPNECTGLGIGACLDLSYFPPIVLPPGATLRGNRRATLLGPQLYLSDQPPRGFAGACNSCIVAITADYARVTGLRLRGQSRSTTTAEPGTEAVHIYSLQASGSLLTAFIAAIDHNDMSDWGAAAVTIDNAWSGPNSPINSCYVASDPTTLANAHIARNFLHHNERQDNGYGVLVGRAFIEGNTFLMNRHAIAAGSEGHTEYRAWYNLKLSGVPQYPLTDGAFNQDFDIHGSGSGAYGGIAGYSVDIAGNTFLGNTNYTIAGITVSSNYNFELRGYPCYADYFRDNVTQRQQDSNGGGVINFHHVTSGTTTFFLGPDGPLTPVGIAPAPAALLGNPATLPPGPVFDYSNQFGNSSPPYTDPTAQLGVGDFDGDGSDDLFLATGAAWYYAPGGQREWRFLSAKTDRIDSLLLGDFDGDGRTDVVGINPSGYLVVSWGGISDWELLNRNPLSCTSTADMAVGKFLDHAPGDRRDDIFCADGLTWTLSYGGSQPFNFALAQSNSFRVKDLRFGDFNGQGKTDVFSVGSNGWQISYAQSGFPALSNWIPLPVSLTKTIDGLIVADFNGDGMADVLAPSTDGWQISYGGSAPFTDIPQPFGAFSILGVAGIGNFTGQAGADVLVWNGFSLSLIGLPFDAAGCDSTVGVTTELCISRSGASPAMRYTTQDMR